MAGIDGVRWANEQQSSDLKRTEKHRVKVSCVIRVVSSAPEDQCLVQGFLKNSLETRVQHLAADLPPEEAGSQSGSLPLLGADRYR